MFPEGLVLDTQKRQYLTSKINALFSAKQAFIRLSEEAKKRIPIKNDEDSDLVAKASGIPNLVLINDIAKVVDFIENWLEQFLLQGVFN